MNTHIIHVEKLDSTLKHHAGVLEFDTATFMQHCLKYTTKDRLKHFGTRNISLDDIVERSTVANNALRDMTHIRAIFMYRGGLSCSHLFHNNKTVTILFILTPDFLEDNLAINKYKLKHPEMYQRLVRGYNIRRYYT